MEKPTHEGKENQPGSNNLYMTNPMMQHPQMQFQPMNMQKKPKTKAKPQKGFSSNLRAGDWVCLLCNNLNFSFRNECNRCQMQTKEQNQLQSLYISEDPSLQNDLLNRPPLNDLTNNKPPLNRGAYLSFHSKSKSTPIGNDLYAAHAFSAGIDLHDLQSGHDFVQSVNPASNKGFENKLLVTPPKHRQNKSMNIFKEYSDSSQKELPPYKSPEHLPSISPIMKDVFGYDQSMKGGYLHQKFTFIKEEADEEKKDKDENNNLNHENEEKAETILKEKEGTEKSSIFASYLNNNNHKKESPGIGKKDHSEENGDLESPRFGTGDVKESRN